jgi:hypothetical protein
MVPVAPAVRATRTASVTIDAPPPGRSRPGRRSRIPASTGAPPSVLIVVANGDRPLRSTCFPAILVWP